MKQTIAESIKEVDFFLFMGQSNMAGRGIVNEEHPQRAPELIKGAGYEYRAISAPGQLFPIQEPFGKTEDKLDGIYDPNKSGSMVTSFVNTWYQGCHVPVIGVSASKGGSSILRWQKDTVYLTDAEYRVKSALKYLKDNNINIRHKYLLWCQGETDGDNKMSGADYKKHFYNTLEEVMSWGVEHCFMIKIGLYNGPDGNDYTIIRQAQEEIASECPNVTMCSRILETMKSRGLMKDAFHYYQQGYNEVGADAATNILNIME